MKRWAASFLLLMCAAGVWVKQGRCEEESGQQPAAAALAAQFSARQEVTTIEADFICMRQLAGLDTTLVSCGKVAAQRAEGVRFSTLVPYRTELILRRGKVLAKSQHEEEWDVSNLSSRPGLTAVMGQIGNWLVGNGGGIEEMYQVSRPTAAAQVPTPPADKLNEPSTEKGNAQAWERFKFTPTNKDLVKVVKAITLGFDRSSHQVVFVQVVTQQGDSTCYWFSNVRQNGTLSAETLEPMAKKE